MSMSSEKLQSDREGDYQFVDHQRHEQRKDCLPTIDNSESESLNDGMDAKSEHKSDGPDSVGMGVRPRLHQNRRVFVDRVAVRFAAFRLRESDGGEGAAK